MIATSPCRAALRRTGCRCLAVARSVGDRLPPPGPSMSRAFPPCRIPAAAAAVPKKRARRSISSAELGRASPVRHPGGRAEVDDNFEIIGALLGGDVRRERFAGGAFAQHAVAAGAALEVDLVARRTRRRQGAAVHTMGTGWGRRAGSGRRGRAWRPRVARCRPPPRDRRLGSTLGHLRGDDDADLCFFFFIESELRAVDSDRATEPCNTGDDAVLSVGDG